LSVLEWLESTTLGVWLRESPSVWSFPTILTLHTAGMAVLIGASFVLDLRLLGVGRKVPLSAFRWVFPVLAFGLVVNLVTGVMLFIKNATVWGTEVPFLIKMSLVVASVATVMPIRKYVVRTDPGQYDGRVLAIASILLWSGAVIAGRLLAYLVI
jgi:hypothetical protein